MKLKSLVNVIVLVSLVFSICLARNPKAPKKEDGSKQVLVYKVDPNLGQLDQDIPNYKNKVKQRKQVTREAAKYCNNLFKRFNYNVISYESLPNNEIPEGALLLEFKITKYNGGSAVARTFLFGAGVAVLDALMTVSQDGNEVHSKVYGYASSVDWRKIIEKIIIEFNKEFTPSL
ncbi:hypothetical protein OAR19_00020 [bacterium]|nr:hypothetical protein [bacterium]